MGDVNPIQRSIDDKDRTGRATEVEKSKNTISTLVSTPVTPMISSACSSFQGHADIFEARNTSSTAPRTVDPVQTTAAENVAISVAASTEPFASVVKPTIISKASDSAKLPGRKWVGVDLRRKKSLDRPMITAEIRRSPHESSAPTTKRIPAVSSDTGVTTESAAATGPEEAKHVLKHLWERVPTDLPKRNLKCPFQQIYLCSKRFADEDEWIMHSLEHFSSNRREVRPPTTNACCFCEQTFHSLEPYKSWIERMIHVGHDHDGSQTFLRARPGIALLEYLWDHRLISDDKFLTLKQSFLDKELD